MTEPNIRGAVHRRLIRGFYATALTPVLAALIQLVSLPIFLNYWGVRLYGEWLILSAIPTYLSLSDIGFGSVAANDMTMRVGAGDRQGALETFQSTWVLLVLVSFAAGIAVLGCVELLPVDSLLNCKILSRLQVRAILLLLCVYALTSLQGTIITAGFRCNGRFALGAVCLNVLRLFEIMVVIGSVLLHGSPVLAAASLVLARFLGTILLAMMMLRVTPWLSLGAGHAKSESIRILLRPAVAFMAIPAASALNIQGVVTVVGVLLGPVAVASFSTMRTLTRFAILVVEAVKNSVWPELSSAYGSGDWDLARRLHRHACQASLLLSIACIAVLVIAGHPIYNLWTHGRLEFKAGTFYLLVALVFSTSLWNASSIVTIAANKHETFSALYLGGSVISLALATIGIMLSGLSGAAAGMLLVDCIIGCCVIRQSLQLLHDPATSFLRAVSDLRTFGKVSGLWMRQPERAGL